MVELGVNLPFHLRFDTEQQSDDGFIQQNNKITRDEDEEEAHKEQNIMIV